MKEVLGEKIIKRLKRMTRNRLCSTFAWWIRRENSWKLRSKNTFSCFEKIKRSLRVPPFYSRDCAATKIVIFQTCEFIITFSSHSFQFLLALMMMITWHAVAGRPTAESARLPENWPVGSRHAAILPAWQPYWGAREKDNRMIFTLFEHHVVDDDEADLKNCIRMGASV